MLAEVFQGRRARTHKVAPGSLARVPVMSATIGVPRRRIDGGDKVRGATRYAADLPIPGVLHARLVLATEAHARIAAIDGEAAKALPGVVDVLTAADLPVSPGAPGRAGEPLAREEVVFAGQAVA